jgi:quercetin dioxygenase-like cupin family protein
MVKAVNIEAALAALPVLSGRSPDTPEEQVAAAFATLATFGQGALFAGSFSGESQWERHPMGDEIVQVLAGATTLTILMDDGPQALALSAGMLTVVPQGRWHRFDAPDGVTVLTATPRPTELSRAPDPRENPREAPREEG